MENNPIACCNNPNLPPVMSCVHIAQKAVSKIYWLPADGEDPKMAWCNICEKARIRDRGWNDYADSVAQRCWVCGGCFLVRAKSALKLVKLPSVRSES